MAKATKTIFIGLVIALPLIYVLELDSPQAITLLIFLCFGTVFIISDLIKVLIKTLRKEKSNED